MNLVEKLLNVDRTTLTEEITEKYESRNMKKWTVTELSLSEEFGTEKRQISSLCVLISIKENIMDSYLNLSL